MENNACMIYHQNHAEINGRNIWHWLIDSPVCQINIIGYETPDEEIKRKLFDGNYEKAERYYNKICNDILKSKI